eukprot:TRINITY_DN22499_c0_g1_i1.p1 TRINITY_DN22499_c0_g1~~TRINITY_DN22499_c0_g1_i1.p1  ORF type:complete len:315 (+),score=60.45 TRINITY_DN22499_c0_g1_i1:76-945(+)
MGDDRQGVRALRNSIGGDGGTGLEMVSEPLQEGSAPAAAPADQGAPRQPQPPAEPRTGGGNDAARQRPGRTAAAPPSSSLCPTPPPADTSARRGKPGPRTGSATATEARQGSEGTGEARDLEGSDTISGLLRIAFAHKRRYLAPPDEKRLVARLHDASAVERKKRGQRLQRQVAAPPSRRVPLSDLVERMYYERLDDSRKAAAQRAGEFLPEADRVFLTKEAQSGFEERLEADLRERKRRQQERLSALAPLAPAGKTAFPKRDTKRIMQHCEELYENQPVSRRAPFPED